MIRPLQPETPIFREAPHNLEAEQALLGGILVNDDMDSDRNTARPESGFVRSKGEHCSAMVCPFRSEYMIQCSGVA